ncbi:uncharacterized protein (TIGR02099 family) [Natronocella acetinitrilica]|uniref:Uncharacterized protein (TIGR02099 family) n=1 Tax=Natronocella acetinitrilica TaxID=414046 RepID=A0AAE3G3X5_9GAMM|nr:YhdP family protein [Natronocella acetinitrilica]MCP1673903.1 uncharacterized protein (TIGR02099 family) [Natronocella acetinitrilica]
MAAPLRLALQAGRLLWLTGVVLLVMVALAITALRLAVWAAPEFRAQLDTAVSDAIGLPVHTGSLGLRLEGLNPYLVLDQVTVSGEDSRNSFQIERLELALDVRASLREQRPAIRELVLEQPDIIMQRDLAGQYAMAGVEPGPGFMAVIDQFLGDFLIQQTRIRVNDGRIVYEDPTRGEIYRLQNVDLRLVARPDGGRQLAGSMPLPPEFGEELAFVMEWGGDGLPLEQDIVRFYARGRGLQPELLERALAPPGESPMVGVAGDLEFWGNLQGGFPGLGPSRDDARRAVDVTVRGRDGSVHLPRLFRDVIPYDDLAAEVRWRGDGADWQLDVDEVLVNNEDGVTEGAVRIARQAGQPVFLDIRATAEGRDGNATRTGRYLPAAIMPARLVDWLDAAITSGTAERAKVLYHGYVNSFPFDAGQGRFSVIAETRGVRLAFWPEWEPLTDLDGTLRFENRAMRIIAHDGVIGGARVQGAEARIDSLGRSPLLIDGTLNGAGDDLWAFLRDMPVMPEAVAGIIDRFRLDGEHGLTLGLAIPFRGEPVTVDGTVHLLDGVMRYPERDINLTNLTGDVNFSNLGLQADGLVASLDGAAVSLSLDTVTEPGTSRIDLSADIDGLGMDAVAAQLPGLDFLEGRGDFGLHMTFPGFTGEAATPPVSLRLESDLIGVVSTLPRPAHKVADERLPFSLNMGIGERPGNLRFAAGERVTGIIGWSVDGMPERVGIGLARTASLPALEGMAVSGQADVVDLAGWLRRLQVGAGDGSAVEQDGEGVPLRGLDLEIGRLDVGTLGLPEVSVFGRRDDGDWRFNLEGSGVAGTLQWSGGPRPELQARLRHLVLAEPDGSESVAADDPGGVGGNGNDAATPRDWPALDVEITRLSVFGLELGASRLSGTRDSPGYRFDSIAISSPDLELHGDGVWQDDGAAGETQLRARGASDNVNAALTRLGYADAIRGGTARARVDLRWPGAPQDVALETLRGDMVVNLRDGQLVQVDPGAGRMLGLISVARLPQRLALNFSDLVSEGFSFDRIRGEFEFDSGIAIPRQLWLDGPAARIEAEGPIDLVAREYDQTVTVVPRSSSALPLLGGLVAGPPGAAALFLAQTVFSDQLDRATRFHYRLTGPWQAPDIRRISRIEASGGDPVRQRSSLQEGVDDAAGR